MIEDLPEGWISSPLGQVADHALGKMLDQAKGRGRPLPYLRNLNVQWGRIDLSDIQEMLFEDDELDRFGLARGDLLVCEGGEPGRCAIWDGSAAHLKFQKALHRVRPGGALGADLLRYQLQYDAARGALEEYFTGSTIKHFTGQALHEYEVLVPPLAEQRRIVAKVEALLAEVNAARGRLAKVPAILKRFRQSVLAAACSGGLTAHLPASVASETCLPAAEEVSTRLPANWSWTSIERLVASSGGIRTGPFGSLLKKHEHRTTGVPVLGIENIGELRFVSGSSIHVDSAKAKALMDYDARAGDLLISRSGTVGEVCVVPASLGEARISTNLMRVRIDPFLVCPDYLAFCIAGAPAIREQLDALCGGSTRDFLNRTILAALRIPLPSLDEQHEIVRRVDELFKVGDAIERHVSAATARADRLTQSILAKAFRGELVPTEAELARREGRSYEPASALLDRIRREREQGANPAGHETVADGRRKRAPRRLKG